MSGFRANLPAYVQIVVMWPRITYVYRVSLAFNLLMILIQVYLLKMVWTALYAGRGTIGDMQLHTVITTLTLANLQLWLVWPLIGQILPERIRSGQVALDLARPVGFPGQMLAQQVGVTLGSVPFVVLAFPLALAAGSMQPPASAGAVGLYVVSLLLAYGVSALMGLLIGLIAFWTLELTGFLGLYRFVSQFLSGALVPLQFFPAPLQALAALLPFQTQAYLPVSMYLGRMAGGAAVRGLAIELFWVAVLYLLARFVWSRAIRRVVIQGG